jgi:hypothetical protein
MYDARRCRLNGAECLLAAGTSRILDSSGPWRGLPEPR